jgi:hypothetical protein
MAYLDLSVTGATGLMPATERGDTRLTAADREVIRFAVREPMSSIGPVSTLRRWSDRLFGFNRVNPLADARLEALRRHAIRLRHANGATLDRQELIEAGYAPRQIDDVEALVHRLAPPKPSRIGAMLATAAAAMLTLAAYAWVKSRIGDSFIAAILVMVLGLPLVVSVRPRAPKIAPQIG